jgi:hypothetical protein
MPLAESPLGSFDAGAHSNVMTTLDRRSANRQESVVRDIRTRAMAALAAALLFGCAAGDKNGSCPSGGADGGLCVPGVTPAYTSCADLTTPTVSFATDIAPIFVGSCTTGGSEGTCHGDPTLVEATTGQLFLGYPEDAGMSADAAMILAALVNQKSPENPQMNIVTPTDPEQSYMMHKLDDDQCQFASTCNATGNSKFKLCGSGMPQLAAILEPGARDTIRRWIAQGAQNN